MADIPSKLTVPSDITMSDPADIKKLQDEIIALYKAVNQLIDVDAEQNKKLDNVVYYKEWIDICSFSLEGEKYEKF